MKRVFLILTLLASALTGFSAETARSVLDKTLATLNSSPALTADFTISGTDGSSKGVLTLAGEKFTIKGDEMAIWFDGKTQWSYSASTGEVNVTEPTDDELAEINPLVLLNADPEAYALKLKKKGQTAFLLELTDRTDDRSIARAVITIAADTWLPTGAEVEMAGGEKASLAFKNIKKLNSVPAASFRFNPKDYPGVEVIDLR